MTAPSLSLSAQSTELPPVSFELEQELAAGSCFHVCSASFRLFHNLKLEDIQVEASGEALPVDMENELPLRHAMKRSLAAVRPRTPLPKGTRIQVKLAPKGERLNEAGDIEWDLRLALIEEEAFTAEPCRFPFHDLAPPLIIHLHAGSATRLEAVRRFNGDLVIRCADALGSTAGPPDVPLFVEDSQSCREVRMPPSGALTLSVDLEETQPIRVRLGSWVVESNPLPRLDQDQKLFFGDIHWHTASSTDGQRSMHKALQSARDELGLDFAGPSEHILDEGDYGRSDVRDQARVCMAFDEPGRFAVIPGFEKSRRYGHCNVYTTDFEKLTAICDRFPEEMVPVLKSGCSRFAIEELVELFDDPDTLIIPHHSNMDNAAGQGLPGNTPAWTAFHWPRTPIPQHLRLIEINQQRGAFEQERPDPVWQPPFWLGFHGGLGGSAETALARGHRIGFIGGTDNHHGWPSLEGGGGKVGGVTAVLADQLDPASIVRAMHARRCYATTGARIVAQAELNGYAVGSEMSLEASAPREFRISLKGTAPFERVELISFGQIAHAFEWKGERRELDLNWSDLRPERAVEDVYYYVRARQQDGHLLWMSPWWIDLLDPA